MPNQANRALLLDEGQIRSASPEAAPVDIRRGMPVRSREGEQAGQVAAVVVDIGSQVVTHVLLSRWRGVLDYRLVPAGLVEAVRDGVVALEISAAAIDSLSAHTPA